MQSDIEGQIPKMISEANEILCREKEDDVIAIMRHFKWSKEMVEAQWFEKMDELELRIGLKFDTSI